MHYYQFNIGDYAKSTLHLSAIEDIAYRRLLDRYYDTESPLELDIDKLCRFIRMREHKEETQQVLEEFFSKTQKGWIQKRVQKELGEYASKARTARENGKKGGRPKKTQPVILANPEKTQEKAKQEPLTKNQEPIEKITAPGDACPHQQIIDLYHQSLPTLRKVKVWNTARQGKLRSRWREDTKHQSLEFWSKFFRYVSQSAFLTGANSDWSADLEWLINSNNFAKVIEGKYHE